MAQLPNNTSRQIAPDCKVIEELGLYTQMGVITQSFGLCIRYGQY